KISSVAFGVLTANSLVPSGDSAIGRTWPLSNSRNDGDVTAEIAACTGPGSPDWQDGAHTSASTRNRARWNMWSSGEKVGRRMRFTYRGDLGDPTKPVHPGAPDCHPKLPVPGHCTSALRERETAIHVERRRARIGLRRWHWRSRDRERHHRV